MKQLVSCSIAFFLLWPSLTAEEFRQWKDTKGQVIEAKLLNVNGDGTIRMEKKGGWVGNVPIKLLSAEDQTYVKTAKTSETDEKDQAPQPKLSQNFEIIRIRRDHVPGFIKTNTGWENKIKCIKVDVRYKGSESVASANIKAYFYNREGKVVERFPSPPRRQDESGAYIDPLNLFESGEKYEVFFPISNSVEAQNWKTVLVTFGNQNETAALTEPGVDDLSAFDFDEKKIIFPGWSPKDSKGSTIPEAGGGSPASNLIPEMRSVKSDKHPYAVRVDKVWKYKVECLVTDIRVQEALPSKISVSAYFFNEGRELVATRERPTMVNLGKKVYCDLPAITEKNRFYPVFFAIDSELEQLNWKWAVVVFAADNRATAKVFGPGKYLATHFKFPGKDQIVEEVAK